MIPSVTVRVKVRFSELDSMSVVWHGNYVKYIEDAREEFGRKFGLGYMDIFSNGYFAPMYDMQLRYEQTARINEDLLVTCRWKPGVGAKICLEYEVRKAEDNSIVLRASTIQLFTNTEGEFDPIIPKFYKEWQERMAAL